MDKKKIIVRVIIMTALAGLLGGVFANLGNQSGQDYFEQLEPNQPKPSIWDQDEGSDLDPGQVKMEETSDGDSGLETDKVDNENPSQNSTDDASQDSDLENSTESKTNQDNNSGSTEDGESAPTGEGETEEPGQASASLVLTDKLGRQVEIPEDVETIAALYSFAGYVVALLERGSDLVAVQGGLQRDVLLTQIVPQVLEAQVIRDGGSINVEELMRLDPDLIILQNEGVADSREKNKLDLAEIPYLAVDYNSIGGQQAMIKLIGQAIDREAEANRFISYYNQVLAKVDRIVSQIPLEERVTIYHSDKDVLRTVAGKTISAEWAERAGLINVALNESLREDDGNYYANIEQILLWNPQVIIANENTAYEYIRKHPQWKSIQAVEDGRVYKLPQGISRWGHRSSVETPLAILWAVKTIYPDYATEIDLRAEVRTYYQNFFGISLTETMIDTILEGRELRLEKGEI